MIQIVELNWADDTIPFCLAKSKAEAVKIIKDNPTRNLRILCGDPNEIPAPDWELMEYEEYVPITWANSQERNKW